MFSCLSLVYISLNVHKTVPWLALFSVGNITFEPLAWTSSWQEVDNNNRILVLSSVSFFNLLEGADSLSLLCLELVDSEFKLRVLGIEESSLQSCSMSSGTTGQGCLRLCLTASQLWCFKMSHPCLVLAIRPST